MPNPLNILLVDDEKTIRMTLGDALEDAGHIVRRCENLAQAREGLDAGELDCVITDLQLPDGSGLDLLAPARERHPDISLLVITAHQTIDTAIQATKLGADYLLKPFLNEEVLARLQKIEELRRLKMEVERLKTQVTGRFRIDRLVGKSKRMQELYDMIETIGPSDATVLITGESGTGKELVAQAIHNLSPRAGAPFVEVNCAAIPEELIESELFGHRKGSFTGASEDKTGKFQKADGGTLFLDEVGDMSLKTQAKVLRALEEQRFEPVGANHTIQVDVRVVAATNKNLQVEIERGNFREDLFYRLNVVPFYVPPLRDRIEDVPLLAEHFLNEFTHSYGRKRKELTPEAMQVLREYHWPGNVRELKNLMERIVIMNPQVRIDARHLPPLAPRKNAAERPADHYASLHEYREAAERDYIARKLEEAGGNMTRASELLGLERSNLYRKMKALGIAPKDSPAGA